jgi:hypothetical protein
MRPKARGLAQRSGPPGWLDESGPAGVILYVIGGPTKENKSFLIYKKIQSGAVSKSYMRKGFLRNEEVKKKCANISPYIRRPLVIYDFATAPL